jgi:hypothetical protein
VGSKIRISVTNLDRTPTDSVFFGTNPFVLPVLVNSTNNIFLGGGSYLELPVISSTALAGELSANATDDKPSVDFSLKQNYPNPFNPVTLIEYSIAKAGTVQIRVYDILGKEIKVLVNEYAEAGTHRVEFNASSLSSGIYFYTINSGGFRDVKRMVLIK